MKGGIVCQKKEMTKMWLDGRFEAVTLLAVVPQDIVRYKSEEKDGYEAVVIGYKKKKKDKNVGYNRTIEFKIDKEFAEKRKSGDQLSTDVLEGVAQVDVVATSKGKGFQGAMKRFHLKGGPKTHGSKFHRQVGSLGNRKPRRVQMGHPHAGRMGLDRVTLHDRKVVAKEQRSSEQLVVVKGSVPGHYNTLVQLIIK